jgi:hypothetical protein
MKTEFVYGAVRADSLNGKMYYILFLPRIRRAVATFSPRRPGSSAGSDNVRLAADKMALGTSVFRYLYHSVSAHTHPRLNITIMRRTSGRSVGDFKESNVLSDRQNFFS